jgi:hypothetical protein
MLTEKEQEFILKNATNWYHLVDANSHLFGEPFLEDNYVYYFDGFIVTFIPNRLETKADSESINRAIEKIAKKHDPDNLIVWGEVPSKEIDLAGYKSSKREIPIWKNEMRFRTKNFTRTRAYKKAIKKAKSLRLELKFVRPKFYKSDYTKLLAETHPTMLDLKSASYYSIYPHVPYVRFTEVWKDGKLVSVHILVELLPKYIVLAEIGYNKDFPRISAIDKALLIEHYIDKAEIISLGGCASEGIFEHKKQLIGKIPFYEYPDFVRYEFYKKDPSRWWLERMAKK